jgi:Sap, sulfolipid-1-addressing protein
MIWQALGAVLGQAMGVALSPAAIIAVVLVLFSARARLNSALVLVVWFVGVTVSFVGFGLLADGADVSDPDSGGSTGLAIVQLLLGALFLALAAKQWRDRPRAGTPPKPNKLFDKIGDMGPGLAAGLGLLMSALNPKNLTLIVSAAGEVARLGLSTGDLIIVAILFAIISMIGVGIPVVLSIALGDRAIATLTELRDWMIEHNTAIMLVLFVVLGAKTLGTGLGTLLN